MVFLSMTKGEIVAHSVVIDDNKMSLMSKEMYEATTIPSVMNEEATRLFMKYYDNWISYRLS